MNLFNKKDKQKDSKVIPKFMTRRQLGHIFARKVTMQGVKTYLRE